MTQKLDTMEMQNALALSQAACYASMSAKEHDESSDQAKAMLRLTNKLVDMTLAALDAAVIPEPVAAPGEATIDSYIPRAYPPAASSEESPALSPTVDQTLQVSGADNNVDDHIEPLPSDPIVPVPDVETNTAASVATLTTNTTPSPTMAADTPSTLAAPGVTADQTPIPEVAVTGPELQPTTVQGNLTGPEEDLDYKPLPLTPAPTVTDPTDTSLDASKANALPVGAASPSDPVGQTVV